MERRKPGSDEAIKAGCTCAILDNNHGRFAPYPPDGWWISGDCPLHGIGPEPSPSWSPNDLRERGDDE